MTTLKQHAEAVSALVADLGPEKAATLRVMISTGQGGSTLSPDAENPGLSFISGCTYVKDGEHGHPECVLIQ